MQFRLWPFLTLLVLLPLCDLALTIRALTCSSIDMQPWTTCTFANATSVFLATLYYCHAARDRPMSGDLQIDIIVATDDPCSIFGYA